MLRPVTAWYPRPLPRLEDVDLKSAPAASGSHGDCHRVPISNHRAGLAVLGEWDVSWKESRHVKKLRERW